MSGPVVLTRPRKDSKALAEKLAGQGCEVIVAPLIDIHVRERAVLPEPAEVQAVVFTSANGISGLVAQTGAPLLVDVPAIAVGSASAAAAYAAGFSRVVESGGDVAALVDTVGAQCAPDAGVILYPSGVHTAGDLEGQLQARGFSVERVIVYEAVHAAQMPAQVHALLEGGERFRVVLFSPRTARIWCELLQRTDLHQGWAYSIHYYCLSQNVADALKSFGVAVEAIEIAGKAKEQAMLALLAGGGA